ncbi:DUF4942 domain-containing protein [Shewanella oncorhynchi]|uniref:DUF4942 domain-containing protein n=1 Tax=Shewanella oncorhynchi TaxID=2726434 RepID=UPI003D7A110F
MTMNTGLAEINNLERFATAKRVIELKMADEDHEWYPTSEHIFNVIRQDLIPIAKSGNVNSLLDIGCGDGRVLAALNVPLPISRYDDQMVKPFSSLYGIEKSLVHCRNLDKNIFVIGTDFNMQTLVDKPVDVIFCNPIYSEFEAWATRIIEEANASYCYLVLPKRWSDSDAIASALKTRMAQFEVIGTFNFDADCDRLTRHSVPVDIIRVQLAHSLRDRKYIDPFVAWFDKNFDLDLAATDYMAKHGINSESQKNSTKEQINALVPGADMVQAMQSIYDAKLASLCQTYQNLSLIDQGLLRELEISKEAVLEGLRLKIKAQKSLFWKELFGKFEPITSRMTSDRRKRLLELLEAQVSVDFTAQNAYAIAEWAIKNADAVQDEQFKDFYQSVAQAANCVNYVSNERTWKYDKWSYRRGIEEGEITHFKLDYRCVLENKGGFDSYYGSRLSKSAEYFLDDFLTISSNLGFNTLSTPRTREHHWASNKAHDYRYLKADGSSEILFTVRAFLNGNLHIKMNPKLALKMNVVAGRLFGWVRNAAEAEAEMQIKPSEREEVAKSFKHSLALSFDSQNLLMAA